MLLTFAACMPAAARVEAQAANPPPGATTDIHVPSGEWIATATFVQAQDQVLVSIAFRNRTALVGTHAIHIHEVGQCYPPGYETAGAVLNPYRKQHGLQNSNGPMAGDLPNLVIGPAGVAVYNLSAPQVTLSEGPASLVRPQGTSLVIFAQADDDRSQPEGNAGARIACGAIVPTGTPGSVPVAAAAPPQASSAGIDPLTALAIAVLGGLLVTAGVVLRQRGARTN